MNQKIIGVDIGGTKCAISLGAINESGLILVDKHMFNTGDSTDVDKIINEIILSISEVLHRNELTERKIGAIGISCGGPLDVKAGLILSPPNLIGWDNVAIVDILQKRFDVPVKLQNDANACTLAEWRFGAARGYENAVFLTFGTGLGAGLILNGKLYSGSNDMAGEVGHIRLTEHGPCGYGKMGSFEGFCSGGGIAQLAKSKVYEKFQVGQSVTFCPDARALEQLDARTIASAARDGDELAQEIFRLSGESLGKGLAIIIDILNPQVIVIGGIFARCHDLLWPSASIVLSRECLPSSLAVCQVVPAELGDNVGDYAALAVALNDQEVYA
ncbi:ROK family protein [Salmonella enterica subsp. enterica serovar Saintpaul]|nr:ROK family protein [Salmonella enterica subsp. enterica serovar Saintpaul]